VRRACERDETNVSRVIRDRDRRVRGAEVDADVRHGDDNLRYRAPLY
jgi:hypothetical protein